MDSVLKNYRYSPTRGNGDGLEFDNRSPVEGVRQAKVDTDDSLKYGNILGRWAA